MKTDVVVLTKCANGLVYKSITELCTYSRDSIGKLVVCYTGDDSEEVKKLGKMLDDIPVSSVLDIGEYNFAKLNNEMVKRHASSECILFMNDDVIIENDAVGYCLKQLEHKEVGAVGMKLLYPDRTVQHAGVFWACNNLGKCTGVGHIYFKERNRTMPDSVVLGVTGAFLMMRTEDFKKIGGFDERFKHCFEDVVLCKRIRDTGKQIVCCNSIEAVHYESLTRKQASCREDFDLMLKILNGEEK